MVADIHINETQIAEWRSEVEHLEEQARNEEEDLKKMLADFQRRQEKIELLQKRLRVIDEGLFDDGPIKQKKKEPPIEKLGAVYPGAADIPLPISILKVLDKAGVSLSHIEIRKELTSAGVPKKKLGVNTAYYYTAVKRLEAQKKVFRTGNKYQLSPNQTGDSNDPEN